VITVIVLSVLAVAFVVLLWVRSAGPENQGAELGHNSPWPDSVFIPPADRPRLGSPETLESHEDPNWVDNQVRRARRRRRRSGG
jgi:hypothetical protein